MITLNQKDIIHQNANKGKKDVGSFHLVDSSTLDTKETACVAP